MLIYWLNELIKPISKINKIAQNDFSCIHCRCAKIIYLFKKWVSLDWLIQCGKMWLLSHNSTKSEFSGLSQNGIRFDKDGREALSQPWWQTGFVGFLYMVWLFRLGNGALHLGDEPDPRCPRVGIWKRFRFYRGKVVRGTGRLLFMALVGALLGSIAWYTRPRPARSRRYE